MNTPPMPSFVVSLPEGYDRRCRVCVINGSSGQYDKLIVVHPTQRSLLVDMENGTIKPIEPS